MWGISPELQAGLADWRMEWEQGSRQVAREQARDVVKLLEQDTLLALAQQSQEQLVGLLDACRGEKKWSDGIVQKFPEREDQINVFIMANYEPQEIMGWSNLGATTPAARAAMLRSMADAIERGAQ